MNAASKAREGLERLVKGNARFVSGFSSRSTLFSQTSRRELVAGQAPFAVILGCSDSRVPPEIAFDQGLGDLFVIRVAGNIVAPSLVGSIEYAVQFLGTRLIVVLGHSGCGAVQATLDELSSPSPALSPGLTAIVDRIRPAIAPLYEETRPASDPPDALALAAVRANVRASAAQLRQGSALIRELIRDDGLLVVGAEYSLETGAVDFFDGGSASPDQAE